MSYFHLRKSYNGVWFSTAIGSRQEDIYLHPSSNSSTTQHLKLKGLRLFLTVSRGCVWRNFILILVKKQKRTWDSDEKKAVLNYMLGFLKNFKTPRKGDCLKYFRKCVTTLKDRDWTDVKYLVYNTNVTNKRRASKIEGTL